MVRRDVSQKTRKRRLCEQYSRDSRVLDASLSQVSFYHEVEWERSEAGKYFLNLSVLGLDYTVWDQLGGPKRGKEFSGFEEDRVVPTIRFFECPTIDANYPRDYQSNS